MTQKIGDRDAWGELILNLDRAADTPARAMYVYGVKLTSRYGFAHEYKSMSAVVTRMPQELRRRVNEIFCDSKACATYSVEGNITQPDLELVGALFYEIDGGHNGLWGPDDTCVDPDWE